MTFMYRVSISRKAQLSRLFAISRTCVSSLSSDGKKQRWFWYPSWEEFKEEEQEDRDQPGSISDNAASDDEGTRVNGFQKTRHKTKEELDTAAWKLNTQLLATDPEDRFYIEVQETVRVRVVDVLFKDSGPTEAPKTVMQQHSVGQTLPLGQQAQTQVQPGSGAVPFTVLVGC